MPVTLVRAGNPMVLDTTWTGGPVYFLYDDGKVSLQSQNLSHIVSTEFGYNGAITLE